MICSQAIIYLAAMLEAFVTELYKTTVTFSVELTSGAASLMAPRAGQAGRDAGSSAAAAAAGPSTSSQAVPQLPPSPPMIVIDHWQVRRHETRLE